MTEQLVYWAGFCVLTAIGAALVALVCQVFELGILAADFTAFMVANARKCARPTKPVRWFFRSWRTFVLDGPPDKIGFRDGGTWTGFRKWTT